MAARDPPGSPAQERRDSEWSAAGQGRAGRLRGAGHAHFLAVAQWTAPLPRSKASQEKRASRVWSAVVLGLAVSFGILSISLAITLIWKMSNSYPRCPEEWVAYRGSCYSFSKEKKDWNSSQESCWSQGAHLLVISDTWEMDLFKRVQTECFWIGLRNSTSSGWIWEDGSVFNYTKNRDIRAGQYLVLLPYMVHTDSREKVCVQLTHLNESVTLSATLEYQGENRSLIDDVVSEKDMFTCIPFSLPKANSPLPGAFLSVTVKGPTLQFRSRKMVLIQNSESLVFVQTDKPIYKPGQTVLFRIVSLDEDFHPLNEVFPLVYIEDPKKNRLYQWRQVELKMGFIQLFFNLTSEPMQGTYTVVAQKTSGKRIQRSFSVEEYVLPKFEVIVKMPKVITILDEKLKVTVCGLYTFGKPVPGLVSFSVCRKFEHTSTTCYGEEAKAVCEKFSGHTDNYGCISEMVKTNLFQLKRGGYKNKLHVEAKIKEEDTGMELSGTSFSEITNTISRVSFENSDSYYKRGIPFFGQVKLVDASGAPIANETVKIFFQGGKEEKYTTNEEGLAQFALNTSMLAFDNVGIRAIHKTHPYCYDRSWVVPYYADAYLQLKRFYSPSNSFLKIEPRSEALSCGSSTEMRVHYIFTPEAIAEQKEITIYYLVMAKGNIKQAGTHILDLDRESANGVFSLRLPVEADIAPVAQVLVYTTTPNREVIADSVKFHIELCFSNKVDLSFSPPEGLPSSDAHLLFRASPNSLCAVRAVDKSVLLMKAEAELSPDSVYNLLPVKVLHGYQYGPNMFPDDPLDNCIPLKPIVVDGITYSPVMDVNEEDTYGILKAVLIDSARFMYGQTHEAGDKFFSDKLVSVTLAQSTHFRAIPVEKDEISHCLCKNGRKTVAWLVTPISLGQVEFSVSTEALQNQQPCGNYIVETPEKGRKDTVIRQLLVEPEGVEKETTQNSVLCVKGDIMGTAMQNLHQLLQMPFGCGEQNMVLFAPNIYVLDYLNKTGQLSEEVRSKAIGYLVSGYQRQLNYKHPDGSYSTFGPRYGQPGNTWLTAFVLKSFAQARHHIFIDEKHIQDALIWLSYKQKDNGCFQSSGTLLNNAMKGGVDNEVSLTAYITIALLGSTLPVTIAKND
ncbi:alpha-2-macroglobulin-like protein [Willisornis vidua]|uniref:Alpha-2-macroglobulin-like protein n=1 Tax=Willisornis vidua TaxID=1566151 RepID=A0ABQ9DJ93_9PASS|nr:alpha-2-macroglobulin-like protein [Willisornis vidua]